MTTSDQLLQKANSLLHSKKYKQATKLYQQHQKKYPDNIQSLNNLAVAYSSLANSKAAKKLLERVLKIHPDHPGAHLNIGNILVTTGKHEAAIKHYRKALLLDPGCFEAYLNLGHVYKNNRLLDQALEQYQRCQMIKPESHLPYFNLGQVYSQAHKYEKAIVSYSRALELQPDFYRTHYRLGEVYLSFNQDDLAIKEFQACLSIHEYSPAIAKLTEIYQKLCDWPLCSKSLKLLSRITVRQLANKQKTAESPMLNLTTQMSPGKNLRIARSWTKDILNESEFVKMKSTFSYKKRLSKIVHIGFVSSGLGDFPTPNEIVRGFEHFDRSRIKVFLYSHDNTDPRNKYYQHIKRCCDRHSPISGLSDLQTAQLIIQDKIDILVDLKGLTQGARLKIFAYRPAPINISILGYPGTTGSTFIDYFIIDHTTALRDDANNFSEKLIYMPHTYWPTDNREKISPTQFRRKDFGLPKNAFVFASFCSAYKLDPLTFDVWLKLLRQVEGSVLWLYSNSVSTQKRLLRYSKSRGVDSKRIIFATRLPKPEHLARVKIADLGLDTRIVNGHTTTTDLLWAGLPTVTLQGSDFISRVSSSLLSAVGLSELVTTTLDDYYGLAMRLATNKKRYARVENRLDNNRLSYPLFDTKRFTRNLETAFETVWDRCQRGRPPDHVWVKDKEPMQRSWNKFYKI